MPQRTPSCQPHAPESSDSRQKSPTSGTLRVAATAQWLTATTGRIATDPHSWMTAVHWISDLAKRGLYTPAPGTGPKWGPTTVAIAQEIAALSECRPSVDYLAGKLKLSERTVQYHLAHLRAAGLLVYRSIGTRIGGGVRLASHFERTIPLAFDEAFGIRTIGEGVQRRPTGAAPETRKALGKLAKKASRKSRRRRSIKSLSRRARCTPMQGGTSAVNTRAFSTPPSESKLASGDQVSPTQQQSKRTPSRGRKRLNKVGRRYRLARELVTQVPWLGRAQVARVAWIVRHVADAGWTAIEVQAVAEDQGPLTYEDARRPVGMLAHRLKGAHLLFTTPKARRTAVVAWQESRAQEHARHDGYKQGLDHPAPGSLEARRAADRGMALIGQFFAQRREAEAAAAEVVAEIHIDSVVDLTTFSRDDIIASRMAAANDNGVILAALETPGVSEADVRRLYSNHLVDRALNARRLAAQPAF